MTITGLRLRNFRGFRESTIDLKPLTVLLGPNSAGKSSFGHSLAAMAHAQWLHGGTSQATLSPQHTRAADEWPVDLGRFGDLKTEGVNERPYIELLTRDGWVTFGFGGLPRGDDLRLSYLRYPTSPGHSAATPIQNFESSSIANAATSEGRTATFPARFASSDYAVERINEVEWQDGTGQPVIVGLDGLLLQTVRHQTGTEILLSGRAREEIRLLLGGLRYLRASRKRPSRGYEQGAGTRNPLGYAGEWTASVLNQMREADVTYAEPPVSAATLDVERELSRDWRLLSSKLHQAVGIWLKQLLLAEDVETRIWEHDRSRIQTRVRMRGSRVWRDITEVGFGLSQILPVLVGGLLQPRDGLFVVDLPEAHLHSRPQAALADFFCSLALSGRFALVETHSELFFHRLRLRSAMNAALRDMIQVYFIDAPGDDGLCNHPRSVGLDFEDELRWPVGFLQEAWELETQIAIARGARSRPQEHGTTS